MITQLLTMALAVFLLLFAFSWMWGGQNAAMRSTRFFFNIFRRIVGGVLAAAGRLIIWVGGKIAGRRERQPQQERRGR